MVHYWVYLLLVLLTSRKINDKLALYVCLAAPLLILGIDFVNNIEWWQKQLKDRGMER